MNYKKVSFNNADLHLIKTDRFKSFFVEVIFKLPVAREELPKYNFLSWLLSESSLKYPSKRKMAIKLEDLYKASYAVSSVRIGNNITFNFSIEAINPNYIDDKNYLNDIFDFLFEVILHPYVKKNAFDQKTFDIVKNYMSIDINSVAENPKRTAFENALKAMDAKSISSASSLGTKENLEKITTGELYELYLNMLYHSNVDIFIIGNIEENVILDNSDNIKRLFDVINSDKRQEIINPISNYVINKQSSKISLVKEESQYLQSQLVMLFNTINLSKKEQDVTVLLFNYIFGSGGLKSKLYSSIREKYGYCYQIGSAYYKFDNLLRVGSSLKEENVEHAIELVNKALKEMQEGDFTEDDLNDAKQNMVLALNYNKNNIDSLLSNIENQILNDGISIDEKIDAIASITKDDIIAVAKKIKGNINYLLCEDKHEKNNS